MFIPYVGGTEVVNPSGMQGCKMNVTSTDVDSDIKIEFSEAANSKLVSEVNIGYSIHSENNIRSSSNDTIQ